jgi:5'-3' exonuclease
MGTIIVDGLNLAWRCAMVMPPTMEYGMEYGLLRSLLTIMDKLPGYGVIMAWDSKCEWRNDVFPKYKDKDAPDPEEDAFRQRVHSAVDSFKDQLSLVVPQYASVGCEADDVIAQLVTLVKGDIVILSPDTDFQQLVSKQVTVYKPIMQGPNRGTYDILDFDAVCKEWNISHPSKLRWVRALTGCTSDKVPGTRIPKDKLAMLCEGLSDSFPITPAEYLAEYQYLLKIGASKLTPGWRDRLLCKKDCEWKLEHGIRNYRVMTLYPPRTDSFLRCHFQPNFHEFYSWCQQADMTSILSRIINKLQFPQFSAPNNPLIPITSFPSWRSCLDDENSFFSDIADWTSGKWQLESEVLQQ